MDGDGLRHEMQQLVGDAWAFVVSKRVADDYRASR
jgi:hypothetical protein